MNLMDLGALVRARRLELGLNQGQMASLSGLSRTTINLLESNSLNDLGMAKGLHLLAVLGIELQARPLGRPRNALIMASRSSSVSYKETISAQELADALTSGTIPPNRRAHLATLIDELPISMLVCAVEEAANHANMAPKKYGATSPGGPKTFNHRAGFGSEPWSKP